MHTHVIFKKWAANIYLVIFPVLHHFYCNHYSLFWLLLFHCYMDKVNCYTAAERGAQYVAVTYSTSPTHFVPLRHFEHLIGAQHASEGQELCGTCPAVVCQSFFLFHVRRKMFLCK